MTVASRYPLVPGMFVRLRSTGEVGEILTSNRTCGTVVYGITLVDGRVIVARQDCVIPVGQPDLRPVGGTAA